MAGRRNHPKPDVPVQVERIAVEPAGAAHDPHIVDVGAAPHHTRRTPFGVFVGLAFVAVTPFGGAPFPDVAAHVQCARLRVGALGEDAHRAGRADAGRVIIGVVGGDVGVPRIAPAIRPARRPFPLRLGGQADLFAPFLAQPVAEGMRFIPGYHNTRVVWQIEDPAVFLRPGTIPLPLPAGLRPAGLPPLGIAAIRHKRGELGVGHRVLADTERGKGEGSLWRFVVIGLRIGLFRVAHQERPGRHSAPGDLWQPALVQPHAGPRVAQAPQHIGRMAAIDGAQAALLDQRHQPTLNARQNSGMAGSHRHLSQAGLQQRFAGQGRQPPVILSGGRAGGFLRAEGRRDVNGDVDVAVQPRVTPTDQSVTSRHWA